MLKIGSIRWRGKCSKHPGFDPYTDGPGAVKGGCTRCEALADIHECHQKMLRLMRGFVPTTSDRKPDASFDQRQQNLFD
jgi:hypothetical protein